ncbi:MAG: ribonuclease inhibitor [Candidatus Micrarchaeota archaeon]|nr:ribonuclease inhibitor [Candidatus Micrarchaeota archaeon]
MIKTLIIDGNNFETYEGFCNEVNEQLIGKSSNLEFNGNLDAFNDFLSGGFGKFEYREPITIIWKNSEKSKLILGFPETIEYIEAKLETCHPSNKEAVQKELENALKNKGETLFQIIVEIISDHKHIQLKME